MKFLIIFLIVIALMVVLMVVDNNKLPSDIGVEKGLMKPLSSKPNGVSSQADDPDKFVEPLTFFKDLETSKTLIKAACKAYGDSVIVTETDAYMHLVFTTGLMKYKDDVELYFDLDNQLIHYRSESRIGYSDMGLNKARYDEITSYYNKLKEAN